MITGLQGETMMVQEDLQRYKQEVSSLQETLRQRDNRVAELEADLHASEVTFAHLTNTREVLTRCSAPASWGRARRGGCDR
jgi:predicted nuclease with TOPRIM domain